MKIYYTMPMTKEEKKKRRRISDKKWYDKNKEKRSEYNKKWYEKNREKINARQKEKFTCECGGRYTHTNKAGHLRTKKHLNYVEALNTNL